MSVVIRDAVIRLKLEQVKASLEAPNANAIERAFKSQEKAAKESEKATKEASRATKEYGETSKSSGDSAQRAQAETGRAVTQSNYQMVASFREGGEGALRFARGIAFLSASGSADLQRLVQKVAIAQGAFDVFAGGAKLITNIGAAFGGPVALGVAAATAAISTGVVMWSKWQKSAEDAAKAAAEKIKVAEKAITEFYAVQQREYERTRDRESRDIGFALTPGERENRIRQNIASEQGGRGVAEQDIDRLSMTNVFTRDDVKQNLDAEKRRARAAEREAELQRDMYEIQREQAERQRMAVVMAQGQGVAGAAFAGGGGLGGGIAQFGAVAASGGLIGGLDRQMSQLTQSFQTLLNDLLNIVDDAQKRSEQLEKQLESAHSS